MIESRTDAVGSLLRPHALRFPRIRAGRLSLESDDARSGGLRTPVETARRVRG